MAHRFTTSFQHTLGNSISELIIDWLGNDHGLEINIDTKPPLNWSGRPDIWIARENGPYTSILSLEIEHFSGHLQATRNIDKAVEWTKSNRIHRASVIHLINLECRLTDSKCTDLFTYGYENRSKRFGYDFRVYETLDQRASRKLAEDLCSKYDFNSLLRQHLRFLKLVK